jgi:ubiquitin carboxyl-terminal hydrolase 8
MDLSKYKDKGRVGLENLGNTCFLNSCMQVLSNTYELNYFLDSNKYERVLKKNIPDSQILLEWNDLRKVMWSGNGIITPNKFVYNIHEIAKIKNKDIFTGWVQNDMPEFLLFFIECVHNSISRSVNINISGKTENNTDKMAIICYEMLKNSYSKEYSEIMDLFYGVYMSEIVSIESEGFTGTKGAVKSRSSLDVTDLRSVKSTDDEKCHSMKPESFFILDLPVWNISNSSPVNNLYECLDLYCKPEYLEGDNAWFNEKTNQKENVKKQITFWNFPKILVIVLKRFSPDGQQKLNSLLEFPINDLDLSKYVRGYNAQSYKYDLYGICNHMGGVMGGHYTSFVKNVDNQWLHYNDSNVEIVSSENIIVTPMAYCLFYRKKNNLL